MKYARDRAARAGADIGRGPGDGTGDGNAASYGGCDIAYALRDQFAVGSMSPADHAVRNHGGEQRLDRAEDCERERIGKTARIFSRLKAGSEGEGKPDGMAPKREPMVSILSAIRR